MMRVIVASITGIFVSLYIMYVYIPMLATTKTNFAPLINATDPTVVTSYNLGQGFYTVGPLVPVFVAVFLLISYALKGGPDT